MARAALFCCLLSCAVPLVAQSVPEQSVAAQSEAFVLPVETLLADRSEGVRWAAIPDESWQWLDAGREAVVGALWQGKGSAPEAWPGQGSFEASVQVDPALVQQPLALRVVQRGAFELKLDGELIDSAGQLPDAEGSGFQARNQRQPAVVVFERAGEHRLTLTYANPRVSLFHRNGHAAGFRLILAAAEPAMQSVLAIDARYRGYQGVFSGIFLAVAVLHLLLFAFWRETRENLWFAGVCLAVLVLELCFFHYPLAKSPNFLLWVEPAMNLSGMLLCLCILRFLYGIFEPQLFTGTKSVWPRRLWVWFAVIVPLTLMAVVWPGTWTRAVFVMLLATSVEMLRTTALAIMRRQEGSLLVGFGLAAMALGFGNGVLGLLGFLPNHFLRGAVLPFGSAVVLVLTMSVHLSRSVARTSATLRRKLVEVETLSAEKLEHERRERHAAVEQERLQAEIEHQQKELDEARALQLAMLPRQLPEVADLELAAHMETATEVGGDYYDFFVAADGSLTLAVGDATGHGMRAGTLVTATKSLFKALGEGELIETLDRSSQALRAMNLRQLNMALLLARWHAGRLLISGAGMPPVYLYRAAEGTVEDVLLPGLPLGGPLRGRYQEAELRLQPGDTVLFMTDGFPERLDPEDDLFGYERVREAFQEAADRSPRALIEALLAVSEVWSQGRPLDDDLTFVVLRARF